MNEHITLLNLVASIAIPKFSNLLRRVSKVLKFAKFALSKQVSAK
ncbi:hypothetical protein UNSWCD_1290 [Campylobacter concisus UNSWCD]|nr:hypothetical protein UNSWCD_1290 [Campylobacter concisus UNSWCD]